MRAHSDYPVRRRYNLGRHRHEGARAGRRARHAVCGRASATCPSRWRRWAGGRSLQRQLEWLGPRAACARRCSCVGLRRRRGARGARRAARRWACGSSTRWSPSRSAPAGRCSWPSPSRGPLPGDERRHLLDLDVVMSSGARRGRARRRGGTLALVRPPRAAKGVGRRAPGGRIERFVEKGSEGPGLINAGVYLARAGLEDCPPAGRSAWSGSICSSDGPSRRAGLMGVVTDAGSWTSACPKLPGREGRFAEALEDGDERRRIEGRGAFRSRPVVRP